MLLCMHASHDKYSFWPHIAQIAPILKLSWKSSLYDNFAVSIPLNSMKLGDWWLWVVVAQHRRLKPVSWVRFPVAARFFPHSIFSVCIVSTPSPGYIEPFKVTRALQSIYPVLTLHNLQMHFVCIVKFCEFNLVEMVVGCQPKYHLFSLCTRSKTSATLY